MAEQDWLDWQAARRAALEAEDGWLNLTDRVELAAGPQRVGQGAGNDVILSAGPEHLGVVEVTGPGVARFTHPDGRVEPFQPAAGGFPQLRVPPLLLELHTVDDVPALRVRDLTLPRQASLRLFSYDPAWRIEAAWKALPQAQALSIGQKGAKETTVRLTHRAHFRVEGRDITLLPTHQKSGAPMFVIRDATSGPETYAASRFLIGEVRDSRVVLDFNRAHNPPCAFTDFAICPLPPPENRLPFPIRAGELKP